MLVTFGPNVSNIPAPRSEGVLRGVGKIDSMTIKDVNTERVVMLDSLVKLCIGLALLYSLQFSTSPPMSILICSGFLETTNCTECWMPALKTNLLSYR